jgi:hypothetical protein
MEREVTGTTHIGNYSPEDADSDVSTHIDRTNGEEES